jgi:hypothetical protein
LYGRDAELAAIERLLCQAREGTSGALVLLGEPGAGKSALLAERAGDKLIPPVLDRLVAATRGNPLALAELPALLTADQLAGRVPLPDPLPVSDGLSRAFAAQADRLAAPVRRLLLLAAADSADSGALLRAAGRFGAGAAELEQAEAIERLAVVPDGRQRVLATVSAIASGDDAATLALAGATVTTLRRQGLVAWLPLALEHLAAAEALTSSYPEAVADASEGVSRASFPGGGALARDRHAAVRTSPDRAALRRMAAAGPQAPACSRAAARRPGYLRPARGGAVGAAGRQRAARRRGNREPARYQPGRG